MDRIAFLRNQVFENFSFSEKYYYLFYKKYFTLEDVPEEERYAVAFDYAFDRLEPSITPGELIVGKRNAVMTRQEEKEWQEDLRPKAIAHAQQCGGGQDSHMAIDYELLLKKGIRGILATIDEYLITCPTKQISFYNSCKVCLQAVVKHAYHYADTALALAQQTDDKATKEELLTIAANCRRVPNEPAATFWEAVQSVSFVSHCLCYNPLRLGPQQFQLGHPDRYLLPYYLSDLANGTLTRTFAQELLDCMAIQINMRVPSGVSCGYMVGGRDENGDIVANDLTEMGMQVVDDIRLVYPAVGFCHTKGMPDRYLEKAIEMIGKGHSHPAIFNDDTVTKGLLHYGVPEQQAHNYIHSTCVEITPGGASNVWVASPYTNMAQLLLDCMDREYDSLQQLIENLLTNLDERIRVNFEAQNRLRGLRKDHSMNPLLSCFVNDCLKRGTDIEQGGAVYNWIMPSFVGMANLVDSVYAIKQLVFDEKRLTLSEFKAILVNNYQGNETLRQHILNHIPKYGNDLDDIDCYFSVFTDHIIEECRKYQGIHSNGNLIPSVFCWVMHERFGRETMATPDGRPAGFPLGDGSGPCQGRELNGPTASVLSSTKWEHHKLIGGVAVNLKFSKASLGKNSLQVIKAIVETYLDRGGFEVQINVIDNETLKQAQLHPEDYRDLVVRIGGYSDYFVRLSREMQEEVILRSTHEV